MLKNNLSVLLAEQGYSATDVYNATKISKTTLTSLVNNTGKGVQFDTINSLCKFLKVEPKDFFVYTIYDYEIRDFYQTDLFYTSNDPKNGDLLYIQTHYKLSVFIDDGILPTQFEYDLTAIDDVNDPTAGLVIELDEDEMNINLRSFKVLKDFFENSPKIFVNDFMHDLKTFIESKGVLENKIERKVTVKVFDKTTLIDFEKQ